VEEVHPPGRLGGQDELHLSSGAEEEAEFALCALGGV
jgi:hypothetical protein